MLVYGYSSFNISSDGCHPIKGPTGGLSRNTRRLESRVNKLSIFALLDINGNNALIRNLCRLCFQFVIKLIVDWADKMVNLETRSTYLFVLYLLIQLLLLRCIAVTGLSIALQVRRNRSGSNKLVEWKFLNLKVRLKKLNFAHSATMFLFIGCRRDVFSL